MKYKKVYNHSNLDFIYTKVVKVEIIFTKLSCGIYLKTER